MHSQNVAIDMQNTDILLLLLSLINEQNMLMKGCIVYVLLRWTECLLSSKLNSKHDLAFDFAAFIDMFVKQFSIAVANSLLESKMQVPI